MRLSSKVTGAFVGVFLVGGVVGGLITSDMTDSTLAHFMDRSNNPDTVIIERMTERYEHDFQLTPDEMTKIQPLIKEFAENLSKIRRQFGTDALATMDEYHQKIAEQLTPEHRAAYEKENEARRKQLSEVLLPDDTSSSGTK